jgi:hypothetical protein
VKCRNALMPASNSMVIHVPLDKIEHRLEHTCCEVVVRNTVQNPKPGANLQNDQLYGVAKRYVE